MGKVMFATMVVRQIEIPYGYGGDYSVGTFPTACADFGMPYPNDVFIAAIDYSV